MIAELCKTRGRRAAPLGLAGLLLGALACAGEAGPSVEVRLVFDETVGDVPLASIDRLRIESSEAGYASDVVLSHKLARTGESFLYQAAQAGQAFELRVTALASGSHVACGKQGGVIAAVGAATPVTLSLSVCAGADGGAADGDGAAATDGGRGLDATDGGAPATDADGGASDAPADVPPDFASPADARDADPDLAPGDAASPADTRDAMPDQQQPDLPPPQPLGAICDSDDGCESKFCARGVCCKERCGGACQTCSASGACVDLAPSECSVSEPITDLLPLQCVGGGYNPNGDGALRGSNRSAAGEWQLSLTVGDPSPACERNSSADPACAAGEFTLDLGFAAATVTP